MTGIISTNNPYSYSFFLGELEKCLDDPDHLGPLFVKHVSSFFSCRACSVIVFQRSRLYSVCSHGRNGGCTCTLFTARTNPNLSTLSQSTLTLTLRYMLYKTLPHLFKYCIVYCNLNIFNICILLYTGRT